FIPTDALESSCAAQSPTRLRRFFIAAIQFQSSLRKRTGRLLKMSPPFSQSALFLDWPRGLTISPGERRTTRVFVTTSNRINIEDEPALAIRRLIARQAALSIRHGRVAALGAASWRPVS